MHSQTVTAHGSYRCCQLAGACHPQKALGVLQYRRGPLCRLNMLSENIVPDSMGRCERSRKLVCSHSSLRHGLRQGFCQTNNWTCATQHASNNMRPAPAACSQCWAAVGATNNSSLLLRLLLLSQHLLYLCCPCQRMAWCTTPPCAPCQRCN